MADFFGSSKPETEYAPDAQAALKWRKNFIKSWSTNPPEYPGLDVAGLSPLEQQNLADLQGYLQNGTEGWNLAMNQARSTLNEPDTGVNNPAYQAFTREQERLRGRSASFVRRRAAMGGSLDTAPASIAENEMNRSYDDTILQRLWGIEQDIKNRKERAGTTAANLGQMEFSNLLAGDVMAQKERQVQQMQNAARYQQQLNQFLLPFTHMANIAASAIGQGTFAYMDYSPGTYDYIKAGMDIAGGVAKVAGGIQSLGGAGAGGAGGAGVNPSTGIANPTGGYTWDANGNIRTG